MRQGHADDLDFRAGSLSEAAGCVQRDLRLRRSVEADSDRAKLGVALGVTRRRNGERPVEAVQQPQCHIAGQHLTEGATV